MSAPLQSVLVNPKAGSWRLVRDDVMGTMTPEDVPQSADEAADWVAEWVANRTDRITVCGGDGTLRLAVEAAWRAAPDGELPAFTVVDAGTFGLVARAARIAAGVGDRETAETRVPTLIFGDRLAFFACTGTFDELAGEHGTDPRPTWSSAAFAFREFSSRLLGKCSSPRRDADISLDHDVLDAGGGVLLTAWDTLATLWDPEACEADSKLFGLAVPNGRRAQRRLAWSAVTRAALGIAPRYSFRTDSAALFRSSRPTRIFYDGEREFHSTAVIRPGPVLDLRVVDQSVDRETPGAEQGSHQPLQRNA